MSRKELEGIIKKLLGIEYELDDRTSLIKYGGDSLFFGRLQIELKRTFGLKVPIQQLFQNGTIEQLCKVLGIEEHKGCLKSIKQISCISSQKREPLWKWLGRLFMWSDLRKTIFVRIKIICWMNWKEGYRSI